MRQLLTLGAVAVAGVAFAGPPKTSPVPATQEIEVLDPGVDSTGKPKAVLVSNGDGTARVEIPPTLLVHKFFYTGDRTFQGPMLTGGSVIVVLNHPKSQERVYVPLTLPPGAPKVTYSGDRIKYDYGGQAITLTFGLCGNPKVVYGQELGVVTATKDAVQAVGTGVKNVVAKTGLPEATDKVKQGVRNVFAPPVPKDEFIPRK